MKGLKMKKIILYIAILGFLPFLISAQNSGLNISNAQMYLGPNTYLMIGGEVALDNTGYLEISGYSTMDESFENDGDASNLIIKSTVDFAGSLIYNGGNPAATVQRYVPHNAWHLLGSPTTTSTGSDLFFNYNPDTWVMVFDETSGTSGEWNYITDLNTSLPVGMGVNLWVDADKTNVTVEFEGAITADNLVLNPSTSPAITFTDGDHGYNLVCNPFTSPINWEIGDWVRNDLEHTIWVWDESSGNYRYRTSAGGGTMENGILTHSQGYFIRTIGPSPELVIPANARTHQSAEMYKSSSSANEYSSYLILSAHGPANYSDIAWVSFADEATSGFDNGYDATKMDGRDEAPQLFIMEGDKKRSINHIPSLAQDEEKTFPLAYQVGQDGEQQITADFTNLFGTDVILEDIQTGITQNLFEQPSYDFSGSIADNPNRFLLHFNFYGTVHSEEMESEEDEIIVYGGQDAIYVKSSGEMSSQEGQVLVYDFLGRKILDQKIGASSLVKIDIPLSLQHLSVVVIKERTITKAKVFVE